MMGLLFEASSEAANCAGVNILLMLCDSELGVAVVVNERVCVTSEEDR